MSAESSSPLSLRDAALKYASRGIRVAPAYGLIDGRCECAQPECSSPGKHPRTHRGLHDGTTDVGIINEWWRKWPEANIMVCTGIMTDGQYLTVLDVDVKNDHDGHERLREVEQQFGVRVPEAPTVLSGRGGGVHYWFVSPVEVRNGSNILPRDSGEPSGLDVRGEGGYVIAPPSRHYSGDRYTWDAGSVDRLPSWPSWLGTKTERERKQSAEPLAGKFIQGGRNNALTSLAGVMRRKGCSEQEIVALLSTSNRTRCHPPLDPKDVEKIARSVSKYEPSDPVTGTDAAPPADAWAQYQYISSVATFTERPKSRQYLLTDLRTNHGVLPVGKAGMLIAEGGAGKTMALTQLAIAIATGAPWMGTFRVLKPGRTLLILGEEDAEEVQRRLYNAREGIGAPAPPPGSIVVLPLAGVPSPMVVMDPQKNWVDGPFLTWLRGYIAETGPYDLIALDPLSRFAGADAEKDNAAATRFVQALESLGGNVLCAHHNNKESRTNKNGSPGTVTTSGARGVSAFTDGVRWVATLSIERPQVETELQSKLGEIVTVAVTKSNYARKPEPVEVRRADHGTLVPLDDFDMEVVHSTRSEASKSKSAQRRDESDQHRAKVAAEEQAKRAERHAMEEAQEARTASSVITALEHESVLSQADLLIAMVAHGAKGRKDKMLAAIKSHVLAQRVEQKSWGNGKSYTYTLKAK